MVIFHEKTMFFKPHFSRIKHKHFLLNFTSFDREMFNLYEYNNLIILGKQYDDQNGRFLSTSRSKFKNFKFLSKSAHKGILIPMPIAKDTRFPIDFLMPIPIPIAVDIPLIKFMFFNLKMEVEGKAVLSFGFIFTSICFFPSGR